MVELPWDEVNSLFGQEGSCIIEGWVEGTGPEDWQAVLDLVAENGWRCEYSVAEGDPLPLPPVEALFDRPVGTDRARLRVWPHPDVLSGFLGAIGRRLRRSVVLVSEGAEERSRPLIGFDVGRDRVLVRPNG
ncbi:hypothetical protein M8Z33_04850 [Streptomyces sp. ZAF1911]|uniref:hypothetical protein n=1 Tax=Streptomyces sp. ZAF1911 TaxID=2944129 RepID=UPI00237B03AC|nr:hypothetical protein [Streptomyces sp. ZAF1911]MDD9376009.1 hypothetical protein [Streptomyces sp. ZAF1911]